MVAEVTHLLSRPLGGGTYTLSAGVYFFFPETNVLHLEEVDQIFRESKSILHPVQVAWGLPRSVLLDGAPEFMKVSKDRVEMVEHRK